MKALTYVEIDIDFCSLTYGVLPCEASLTSSPPTGAAKCFNTLATCQDLDHFTNDPVTLRFTYPVSYAPREIEATPSLVDVNLDPAILSLGRDLGQRANLRVSFVDHPHSDTGDGFDKYRAERPYDPYRLGTFWGKFRARQPFLRGRQIRLITGVVGQSLAEMDTRHFVVDSFDGPTLDGKYTLIAKDLLKFADGDRAQVPKMSNGFLLAALPIGDNSTIISPSGIGNAEYPASGYVAIGGKEICQFSRTGNVLSLARGQFGTLEVAHAAQDRVQVCAVFSVMDPADILDILFENYADIQASAIPIDEWRAETDRHLGRVYSAVLAEPMSVAEAVSELVEQAALMIWWDEVEEKIRLQVLRGVVTDAFLFTADDIIDGTLKTIEQPSLRISQVWHYFGKINPLGRQDDPSNFRSSALLRDAQAEVDYGGPAIKKIYSRWIPAFGRSIADRVNAIQLARYRDPPRRFSFSLMRHFGMSAERGVGYRVEARNLQDATGAALEVPIQVTRLNPMPDRFEVEAEETGFEVPLEDLSVRQIVIDSNVDNVNLREIHDSLYPEPESGNEVICTIEAGIIVGSQSPNIESLNLGAWPAGVIIKLIMKGRIQGAAGRGGDGQLHFGISARNGGGGGIALFTRFAVEVQYFGGQIWGGGGGGGGGGAVINGFLVLPGGGGGGGAGKIPGPGGYSEISGQPGNTESPGQGGTPQGAGVGGNGGSPGLPGRDGQPGVVVGGGEMTPGNGGPAGSAIDGVSFVTMIGSSDNAGPQVN